MRRRTPRADADGDDAVLVRVWAAGVNPINGKDSCHNNLNKRS